MITNSIAQMGKRHQNARDGTEETLASNLVRHYSLRSLSDVGIWSLPQISQAHSTSGPLPSLFSLPRMFFPQIFMLFKVGPLPLKSQLRHSLLRGHPQTPIRGVNYCILMRTYGILLPGSPQHVILLYFHIAFSLPEIILFACWLVFLSFFLKFIYLLSFSGSQLWHVWVHAKLVQSCLTLQPY